MPDTARFPEIAEALHEYAARERRKVEDLHQAIWRARADDRTHSSSSLSRFFSLASFCPSTFSRDAFVSRYLE